MPLISDPLGQALVLAGVIASALAVVLTPRTRQAAQPRETGLVLISAVVILLAAVLYLWAARPDGLLLGAALFFPAAMLARPKGPVQCACFACGFLIVSLALPIATFSPSVWGASVAVSASIGLALCLGPNRSSQLSAFSGAAIWAALHSFPAFTT